MAGYQPIIRANGNMAYGETSDRKVFVGGLAWETQSETLHTYFHQFGDILEAVVINDKQTGRSKGYGFVTFQDAEAAKRACEDPTPVIDGRRANCNLASLGRPQPSIAYGHLRPAGHYVWSSHSLGGPFIGGSSYRQPVPYGYQQYPYYGYPSYGPEYVFPQVAYNPYAGHHRPQGLANSNAFSYGQMGYRGIQGMVTPGSSVMPYGGRPNVSGATVDIVPMPPTPYLTEVGSYENDVNLRKREDDSQPHIFDYGGRDHGGVTLPSFGQARNIVPAHPSPFSRRASSE